MNNFYSVEEMEMVSFPPFEATGMASGNRCDSVISNGSEFSVEGLKKEIFSEKPARGIINGRGGVMDHLTDAVLESKSRPPTPPDSGPSSPIGPERLRSLIPPLNYGTVETHDIYRSSFPQDRNMDFVKTLKIRSVLYVSNV